MIRAPLASVDVVQVVAGALPADMKAWAADVIGNRPLAISYIGGQL